MEDLVFLLLERHVTKTNETKTKYITNSLLNGKVLKQTRSISAPLPKRNLDFNSRLNYAWFNFTCYHPPGNPLDKSNSSRLGVWNCLKLGLGQLGNIFSFSFSLSLFFCCCCCRCQKLKSFFFQRSAVKIFLSVFFFKDSFYYITQVVVSFVHLF